MRWIVILTILFAFNFAPTINAQESASGKTYAVFVVSYDGKTAIGGVAGTAFFVSETQAITAYHVLNEASFSSQSYPIKKVWLVHENEPAIELAKPDLSPRKDLDRTEISIRGRVSAKYIFEQTRQIILGSPVETEGFVANTGGPILSAEFGELKIMSVPKLQRVSFKGHLLGIETVTLSSNDVNLNSVKCLKLTYSPVLGLSGGPVLVNGRVVAINSFAEPDRREVTYAVR